MTGGTDERPGSEQPDIVDADESVLLRFRVNGSEREGEATSRDTLVDFLRHELGLHGTHVGCEQGVCGACTVVVDGLPTLACLTLAIAVDGAEIQTVEGLAHGPSDEELSPLQRAFREHFALQCGFCTPGMLMAATALLAENPAPSRDEAIEGIGGVLCRCTGYSAVVDAVMAATTTGDVPDAEPGLK